MKRRRSLTHVGGPTERKGDPEISALLAASLEVTPAPPPEGEKGSGEDDPDRAHVHGFHSFAARMHPATAASLVRAMSREGATVLDPFCGSGTILVEARIAGRRAIGTDLNPLAVRLARLKVAPMPAREREALVEAARAIAAFADGRRLRKAGATRRYDRADVELFAPHVLLELDSIRAGISERNVPPSLRQALELVLSSILTKLSQRTSDTSGAVAPRRLAPGFAARLFCRKAEELSHRMADFESLLPPAAPPARVELDDATRLRSVGASTVDAVVSSPPYVGTYDYLAHHQARVRWLGLDVREFAAGEIGARSTYARLEPGAARQAWARELGAALAAMRRVCRPGARVALVLADSAVRGEALRADAVVADVAERAGFTRLARASQIRPHFHGPTVRAFRDAPRREHAIALEKR
jgi:DNA modification methylase